MPSQQSNERFIRADRRNQLEKAKLERTLRIFDKEKCQKALEIDREKKEFAKSLDAVRRTSGFSDQGIPPAGKSDNEHLTAPMYRMGIRLSERRLMGWRTEEQEGKTRTWRSTRKSRNRNLNYEYLEPDPEIYSDTSVYDVNSNVALDDDVFSDDESIQDLIFDPKHLTKCILDDYKSLFSQEDFKLDKENIKRIRSAKFCRSMSDIEVNIPTKTKQRPHTAVSYVRRTKGNSLPIPPRPSTATTKSTKSCSSDKNVMPLKSSRSRFNNYLYSSDVDSDGTDDCDSVEFIQSDIDVKHTTGRISDKRTNEIKKEDPIENGYAKQTQRKTPHRVSLSRLNDRPNAEPIPEDAILTTTFNKDNNRSNSELNGTDKPPRGKSAKQRRHSSTVQMQSIHENGEMKYANTSDMNTSDSESDVSFPHRARTSSSRQRHSSGSTVTSDGRDYFHGGSVYSSMSDLSLDSNGQRRPSKWREFVCADNAHIPPSKALVSVTTVLRAALAFSKNARQRALSQLVQEQNTDANEIIRHERLRRLESKNSILAAISKTFGTGTGVENTNHGSSTDESLNF